MKKFSASFIILFLCSHFLIAQTGTLKGIIKDESGNPIVGASVRYEQTGTASDSAGEYQLIIPSGKFITIIFSHVSFNTLTKRIRVPRNRTVNFSPTLTIKTEEIEEVIVEDNRDEVQGIDKVDIETAKQLPGANAGIEATLRNIGLGVSGTRILFVRVLKET